jgi:uncharacterized Tic20 family protein
MRTRHKAVITKETLYFKISIYLRKIFDHPSFETVILIFILVSSFLLAFESPSRNPNDTFAQFLSISNFILTVVFSIEAVSKIVAYGIYK